MGGTYSSNLSTFEQYLKAPGPKRSGFLGVFWFLGQLGRVVQGARPGDLLKLKNYYQNLWGMGGGTTYKKGMVVSLKKVWGDFEKIKNASL